MYTLESELDRFIETANDSAIIFLINQQGMITYASNYYYKITNQTVNDVVNTHYTTLPIYWDEKTLSVKEKFHMNEEWSGELNFYAIGDSGVWYNTSITLIYNNNGEFQHYFVHAHPISNLVMIENYIKKRAKDVHNIKSALNAAAIIAITDKHGMIKYVNDKFIETSQYERNELIGKSHRIVNSRYHNKAFIQNMWDTINNGEIWRGEFCNKAKDGSFYWVNTVIMPIFNSNNDIHEFISIRTDITKRIEAEKKLEQVMKNDFKKIIQNLQNSVFQLEKNEQNSPYFTMSEGQIAKKLDLTTEFVYNKTIKEVFPENVALVMSKYIEKAFQNENQKFDIYFNSYYFHVSLSPIDNDGDVDKVVGSIVDITERKMAEKQIQKMANYDPLTNLVNRRHFEELVDEEIHKMNIKQGSFSLLFIDLDRFKHINDSLGHEAGDAVLKKVAVLLEKAVRDNDVVSRLGGDEFTILVKNVNKAETEVIVRRILEVLSIPLKIKETEVFIMQSIGISMYPHDGVTVSDLIKAADTAMYASKQNGRNNYRFFTEPLEKQQVEKLQIESGLRTALKNDEFQLYYQPKVDIQTNKIIGFEALIRWFHPQLGLISPNEFIPVAEDTGLIVDIGEWVLLTASEKLLHWHKEGYDDLTMSVNISLRQFIQGDLPATVANVLNTTKLEPAYLELEITESMTLHADHAISTIDKLKEIGVKISIDDFGTGYSSLSYLSKFAIDRLKIDQSFIRTLDFSNKSIIRSIIGLADNLNIDVIAEGVETKEHVQFLTEEKCTEAQGYYYSKPLPCHDISALLSKVTEYC